MQAINDLQASMQQAVQQLQEVCPRISDALEAQQKVGALLQRVWRSPLAADGCGP